ncbi:hypothetical protein E8E12_003228 [Didymella heteroderae]|uniref:Uncharacterized protein n=1 Tax=Didymella heteroderae TaxID=1769908 RepID=A0A9P4WJW6_9PLEO|nr:hypothetical protein E8E12_003228 [Didymella heteroderae]
MNSGSSGIQVGAWSAVGVMLPEAVFARLKESVAGSLDKAETAALSRNFRVICDVHGRISEPQFTISMLSKSGTSPGLTEAVHILFSSLCYLSQVLLQTISPPPTFLTLDGLKRALMCILTRKEQSVSIADVNERVRSPADHLRLIFQSMANTHEKVEVPMALRAEQSLTVFNTTTVPTEQICTFRDHGQHFDGDGDEMFHDVLDVLWSTVPHIPVGHAEPIRDAFRPLAKELHEKTPSLYGLAVPAPHLRSVLSLLVATSFDEAPLETDQDLELVTQCIAASFLQVSKQYHSQKSMIPDGDTTWPMFHFAITKLLPTILDSLSRLMSKVFWDGTYPYVPHAGPRVRHDPVITMKIMGSLIPNIETVLR